MKRQFSACQTHRRCIFYLQQFPCYSNRKCKKIAVFTYLSPHFCFPWRRPCDYHAICCMDGKTFNACQTPRSTYLSIFNSFRAIRCLSHCVKSLFLPHFCFPWGRHWGNHAKCCMDVVWMEREFDAYKLFRCICPSNYNRFWDRSSEILVENRHFFSYPLAFDALVRGVPVGISPPGLVSEKLEWCGYLTVKKFEDTFIRFDMIHERDGRIDGRTDTACRHRPRLCIASRGKN